jgi:hypothetical protein
MIGSMAENDFIRSKIHGPSWIGATDSNKERRWLWYVTGEMFWDDGPVDGKFSYWDTGEPEGSPMAAERDCAGMSTQSSGKWSALNCAQPGYRAVCEQLDPIP